VTLSNMYGFRLLAAPGVRRSVLVVVLVVILAYRALQLIALSGQIQWGYDFSAYWLAARHVLDGVPIYADWQLAGQYSPQQQYLYLYPPFLAVAMTPLAAIFPSDYRLANLVWAVFGAIVAAVVVAAVARREGIGSRRDTVLLVAGAFAFPPLIGELVMGNVHLLLLGLLGGAWLALRDERRSIGAIAGILIGVATLIKLFPGLVIVWLLLRGRYGPALWSLATIVALAVVALPVTAVGAWLDYPMVLLNLGPPVDTRDTLAPIVWLSSFMPSLVARVVVVVAMVAAVVWAARNTAEPVSFAVTVTASILIAPALYQHYLAILVLPLLLALRWAPPWTWVAVAYVAMFGGEQAAFGQSAWIINRLLPTLGSMLLLVGLMIWGSRMHVPDSALAE
jgi:alpha-1,2-mannosyltransferase